MIDCIVWEIRTQKQCTPKRPWLRLSGAPPIFSAHLPFERSKNSDGLIEPIMGTRLISLQTRLIGSPDPQTPSCESSQILCIEVHSCQWYYGTASMDGQQSWQKEDQVILATSPWAYSSAVLHHLLWQVVRSSTTRQWEHLARAPHKTSRHILEVVFHSIMIITAIDKIHLKQ